MSVSTIDFKQSLRRVAVSNPRLAAPPSVTEKAALDQADGYLASRQTAENLLLVHAAICRFWESSYLAWIRSHELRIRGMIIAQTWLPRSEANRLK